MEPAAPHRERLLLAMLAALAILPLLGARDLWHSDEPRYAQVAREIVTSGDAVVMHVNDAVYREKPPLLFWMQAAIGHLRGDVDPIAARLPAALFAILGVVLTYEWARRLGLCAHAFLAAALLATSFDWWWLGQRAAFDGILATWIVAALLCEELARTQQASGHAAGALRWRLGFAACLGLGFLTKGPPVLIFGLIGRLVREWAAWRTRRLEPGWRAIPPQSAASRVMATLGSGLLQLLVFAAVLSIWIGPLWHRLGLDDLLANFRRQTAGRMGEDAPHSQPPWYYLTTLPIDALPWSIAWLVAGVVAWRQRRRPASSSTPAVSPSVAPAEAEARRFLLAFVVVVVVIFSAIRGKRSLYLMPLQPAIAMLSALVLAWLVGDATAARRKWFRFVVATCVLLTGGALWVMPRLDRGLDLGPLHFAAKSPRPLGAALAAAATPDDVVVALSLRHPDSLRYYSEGERRAHGLPKLAPLVIVELPKRDADVAASAAAQELRELASRHGSRLVIVCEPRDAARLPALLGLEIDQLVAVTSDDRDYVIVRVHR